MGTDNKVEKPGVNLFVRYKDEINKAYEGAVRDALLMHKRAGNPVAVEMDGKLVILQPDEIPVD